MKNSHTVNFRTETYYNGTTTLTGDVNGLGFDFKINPDVHVIDVVIVDPLGKPYANQESFDDLKDAVRLRHFKDKLEA